MRILIVGGTGVISSEVVETAVTAGHDVTMVTRGRSTIASTPTQVTSITADATSPAALRTALAGADRYDAVVQCVAFDPLHVSQDVDTFAALTDQYVLVSTSAAYATWERHHHLTEDDPQENLFWEYAALKAEAEVVLRDHATQAGLPFTIVRPAHTYGPSKIPAYTGNSRHPWTIVDRMRSGADVVVPGDGTSLWTLTHARDVATAIVGLLGNPAAAGRAVHITSDEALTWNALYAHIAATAGLSPEQWHAQRLCVPSDALVAAAPTQRGSIYGDKMHPALYDNSVIKELVPGWQARIPFADGIRECVEWFEADPSRQRVDSDANAMFDSLAMIYRRALAEAGA
ncbi:NAD-dependent epimerase/dehydratase family protein [Demequina sp. B12]|uniref:NAD-dependent epimerase/dehydratase family protein n=1 Tax=Demequina sp. B12 TaxID=2992757 RepID=UPI00237C07E4|nr:NAD-dependent epimerase/dehydratase family protein [Demequina sp. B12]MDE0573265.1 NAD-dependent epimerase/dehydratase family protein [Demequina sp. B12]